MVDSAQNFDLDQIKVKNKFIIIMTILDNYSDKKIRLFRNKCRTKKIKFFVKNDLKSVIKYKADGIYISAYNKSLRFCRLNHLKIDIIGSAHNLKELIIKIRQNCTKIVFSRIFKTDYKFKNTYLGLVRFNLFSRLINKKLIPLGGIRENNLRLVRLSNSEGFCLLSEIKKKPAKIINRLF